MLIDGKALAAEGARGNCARGGSAPAQSRACGRARRGRSASRIYVSGKERDCEQCGFMSREYKFDDTVTQETLLELISALNRDAR